MNISDIIFVGGLAFIGLLIWKYKQIQGLLLKIALEKKIVIKVFFQMLGHSFQLMLEIFSLILNILLSIFIYAKLDSFKRSNWGIVYVFLLLFSQCNVIIILLQQVYGRARIIFRR